MIDFSKNLPEFYSKNIFKYSEIREIHSKYKNNGYFKPKYSLKAFISDLKRSGHVTELSFHLNSRKEIRYLWGNISIYQIALSIRKESYFTHLTAMYLNSLLKSKEPEVIYVNKEQPKKKYIDKELQQENIDFAFKQKVRITKSKFNYNGKTVFLLNGKSTDHAGVVEISTKNGLRVPSTNIERTLIDITVRSNYAGGVMEVLRAYKNAHNKLSIHNLLNIFKAIDYIYPYHQAIGFYLTRAGVYKNKDIALFKRLPMNFDFYLTHNMSNTNYSKEWRIYYPQELDKVDL